MKTIRGSKFLKVLILAVGALAAASTSAYAQTATGKFTLTHETRWGNVMLAPGDYIFSLRSSSLPAPIMVSKAGSEQVAIVLPWVVSTERAAGESRLVLLHSEGGESFISALYLADLGVSLHYPGPKGKMPEAETPKLGLTASAQPGK